MTGIVGLPSLTIDLGIGYGPNDVRTGTVVWTAITSHVRLVDGLSWERGRSSERDTVSAGRASFAVNTRSFNTAFGSAPDLRTPIRIRYSGTTIWTGSIDQWDGTWTGGLKPVTRVSATELLSRAAMRVMSALPVEAQKAKGPAALFPLDEEASSSSLASIIPQTTGAAGRLTAYATVGTTGTATWGAGFSPGSVANAAESTVASFSGDLTNYRQYSSLIDPIRPAVTGVTVEAMLLPASWPASTCWPVALQGRDSDDFAFALGLTSAGVPTVDWLAGGSVAGSISGGSGMSLTTWTHVAVTVTAGGSARLYVNGTQQGSTTSISSGLFGVLERVILGTFVWDGNVANIGVYPRQLSGSEISDIAAGRTGFTGETTTARASRIAGYCGWPITVGTGSTTMGPQPTKGVSLADVMQQIADTEVAPYWMTGDATLRLDGRSTRYSGGAADFTIPATALDQGTAFGKSDVGMVNKVTVEDAIGNKSERSNAASVARYDPYETQLSTYVTHDDTGLAAMDAIAEGLANWQATPRVRSDSLTVDLITAASTITNYTACVLADVGDIIAITGLPTDHGTTATGLFFVEGVSDSVTTSSWSRTFNVSPADMAAWVLGDATYGVLDSTTRLGF